MDQSSQKGKPPGQQGAAQPKADGASGNKHNEGPDRVAKDLDESQQWDEVSESSGFQKGDQGGYKGSYDETKFEQIQDDDIVGQDPHGDPAVKKGDDDGRKTPMKQNDQTTDKRNP